MRKILAASALTVASLGLTAGAASASTEVDNEHGNVQAGDGVNVVVNNLVDGLLANSDVLNGVDVDVL